MNSNELELNASFFQLILSLAKTKGLGPYDTDKIQQLILDVAHGANIWVVDIDTTIFLLAFALIDINEVGGVEKELRAIQQKLRVLKEELPNLFN